MESDISYVFTLTEQQDTELDERAEKQQCLSTPSSTCVRRQSNDRRVWKKEVEDIPLTAYQDASNLLYQKHIFSHKNQSKI